MRWPNGIEAGGGGAIVKRDRAVVGEVKDYQCN